MNKPAEYRQNAALCLEAMRAAEVPEVKESLQTLARRWNDLADRAESGGRDGGGGGGAMSESPYRIVRDPWQQF